MFDPAGIDAAVFPEVGDLATFSPRTGDDVENIYVMVDDLAEDVGLTRIVADGALISALRADVGRPIKRDEFIVGDQTWEVERPYDTADPSVIVLACKKG